MNYIFPRPGLFSQTNSQFSLTQRPHSGMMSLHHLRLTVLDFCLHHNNGSLSDRLMIIL